MDAGCWMLLKSKRCATLAIGLRIVEEGIHAHAKMIRRRGDEPEDEDSSSGEEDAFSALSRKTKKRQKSGSDNQPSSGDRSTGTSSGNKKLSPAKAKKLLPVALTSSMKRHHKPNEIRKAKMDALLQELEAEKNKMPKEHRFVPEKKGSFVEPSEEHLTTNIFVGNLAPSITEYVQKVVPSGLHSPE
jgi:hypothetical protein